MRKHMGTEKVGRVGESLISSGIINFFTELLKKRQVFLEIGSYDGVPLSILAEKNPLKKFYAIDAFISAWGTDEGHLDYFLVNTKYLENVYLLRGKTRDILPILKERIFDIIFVDGDHSYEGVLFDLESSYQLLKEDGYLCMHDYNLEPTKKAIDKFTLLRGIKLYKLPNENLVYVIRETEICKKK